MSIYLTNDNPRIRNSAMFWIPVLGLSLMLSVSGAHGAQGTITLDFESQTPGSTTVPTGWSYKNSGLGASGTYSNTATGGGSPNTGLGGLLASPHLTHSTKLPYSFLVNSGSQRGFPVTAPITGRYDFNISNASAYDSSCFLFGDIKNGTISGTDPGQLLLIYHSNGGYGNAPSYIVNGANVSLISGGTFADNTWYRSSFTWTPTNGQAGVLSFTSQRWSGSAWVAHTAALSASGHVFTSEMAYFGVADLWAANTTFDNISVTGEVPPAGTVIIVK